MSVMPDHDIARAFHGVRASRPAGLAFRPIGDDDLPFLSALYAATRCEELAQVPWPEEAKRTFLAEQFELQHAYYQANSPGADRLVVMLDGEPVGRVYVYRTPGDIRLMDIALEESVRGRGLASAMLDELMYEARASGANITLHVEPANPARTWYERRGFRLIEERGVYLYMGWQPV
ncbi:MAG TPA: GNAT family N-acetyltransferase [Xanthomonadaceae bacterium]|nr:GNAT family N-acetyltransferase [Xanthomonadaceae bacterium]